MLSSTMRIQGKGFLRSAISLLLSDKEEVKNEIEFSKKSYGFIYWYNIAFINKKYGILKY